MNTALRTGIATLAGTVRGLSSLNVYYQELPYEKKELTCVFLGVTNPPTIDSGSHLNFDVVQFDFYGPTLSALETVVEAFDTVFDLSESLVVTGYSTHPLRKVLERGPTKEGSQWRIIRDYLFITEKERS